MATNYSEIFKKRLKEKFPRLKAIGIYQGMRKPIKIQCLMPRCNHTWDPIPDNLLNKVKFGCPKCAQYQQQLQWREDTLKWIREERPDLILKSELVDYSTPTRWKCSKEDCGHQWSVDFNSIRGAKSGCPECGKKKSAASRSISRESYESWLKTNRPCIELVEYKNQSSKAKFKCLNANHITNQTGDEYWETIPEILRLQNRGLNGCPACGWRQNGIDQRKPEAEVRAWMKVNKPSIEMLDGYTKTSGKFNCRCKICDYPFQCSYNQFSNNDSGCPQCAGVARVTEEDFLKRLRKQSGGDIQLIGKYSGYGYKTEFQCCKANCNHIWNIAPVRLTSGTPTGCPACTEGGFDVRKPAWLYLMGKSGEQQFGITNDLVGRVTFHRRNGFDLIDHFGPARGQEILNKESELKEWLKKSIGLHVPGKQENWPTQLLTCHDLAGLFKESGVNPLSFESVIDEDDDQADESTESSDNNFPDEWLSLPKTRVDAFQKGIKRYFDRRACRQGHISPRFTSGGCCECLRLNQLRINERVKKARKDSIEQENETIVCPECKTPFIRTPDMRADKVFCSSKCAEAESKRNYVKNNPEKVKFQKAKSAAKRAKERKPN